MYLKLDVKGGLMLEGIDYSFIVKILFHIFEDYF